MQQLDDRLQGHDGHGTPAGGDVPVGRVVATERKPNTAYQFHFWTPKQSRVGIGTLVKVVDEGVTVYGVVVEGVRYSDLDAPMSDYYSAQQNPAATPATQRPDLKLFTAAVLRMEPEEPVQPVPLGLVYMANDEDVSAGLRMDGYQAKTGIPVGLYQNGDDLSPVYLDWEFLLGPESAHLNITGVSGLATKTSALEFILQGIFAASERMKRECPQGDWSVAAVLFNVKGPDLLFLDMPQDPPEGSPEAERYRQFNVPPLREHDRELYRKLGIPCEPFKKVYYYAPLRGDLATPNTLRRHPDLPGTVRGLSWGLRDILPYAEVVLNRDDIDAKADALIEFVKERVVGKTTQVGDRNFKVDTFAQLGEWFDAVLKAKENKEDEPCAIHAYETVRKVWNRLCNLPGRYTGLISPDSPGAGSDDFPGSQRLEDGAVYCIDISQLDSQAQDLVFTKVVSELRSIMEKGKEGVGVKHVIICVDELNKYAPADGPDTHLKRTLLDISERGRYLGLVLFSAQQFRSQVHKRVVGNCATSLYGRMDMDELATPGYQTLTQAVKEKLATLDKGQLMIRHPHFSQPVFIKFPQPNILRGSDARLIYAPSDASSITVEGVFQKLHALEPSITRARVEEAMAGHRPPVVHDALYSILMARPKGDLLDAFRRRVRQKAGVAEAPADPTGDGVPMGPAEPDPDDPFA